MYLKGKGSQYDSQIHIYPNVGNNSVILITNLELPVTRPLRIMGPHPNCVPNARLAIAVRSPNVKRFFLKCFKKHTHACLSLSLYIHTTEFKCPVFFHSLTYIRPSLDLWWSLKGNPQWNAFRSAAQERATGIQEEILPPSECFFFWQPNGAFEFKYRVTKVSLPFGSWLRHSPGHSPGGGGVWGCTAGRTWHEVSLV